MNSISAQQITLTNKFLKEPGVDRASGRADMWPASNPFQAWQVRDRDSSWESMGRFSPTAKVNVEYIDCTDTTALVPVEQDSSVPRFSVTDSGNGIFSYNAGTRSYEEYNATERNHGDIAYWQQTDNQLAVRSPMDEARTGIYSNGGIPWHNGTLAAPGICLEMRLTVYEPSSCSSHTIVTAPINIQVGPEQIGKSTNGTLSVASTQEQQIWKEDELIPLLIDVDYDKLLEDSALFYFSHITIEDMGKGHETESFAGDWDLFLYSEHAVAPQGYSDATGVAKITRDSNNTWMSYSNTATRFLHQNPTHSFASTSLQAHMQNTTDTCGGPGDIPQSTAGTCVDYEGWLTGPQIYRQGCEVKFGTVDNPKMHDSSTRTECDVHSNSYHNIFDGDASREWQIGDTPVKPATACCACGGGVRQAVTTSAPATGGRCLAHARTTGQGLFGNTSAPGAARTGIYLRNRKGSNTNIKMNITIWSIDGPAESASGRVAYDTVSQFKEFSHTPRGNVRMDQEESCPSTASLLENELTTAQACGGKMHIPTTKRSSYTDTGDRTRDVQLCTYTHKTGILADTWASPGSLSVNGEDLHDTLCDKDSVGADVNANVVYNKVPDSRYITRDCPHVAGSRLTCETPSNNQFTESRITWHPAWL